MDRRTTLKWVLAALATVPLLDRNAHSSDAGAPTPNGPGYGTDPDLTRIYHAGDLWLLSMTPQQRRTATALSDLIIPADAASAGASSVGVVDFIDEWISAPYPRQKQDRDTVLDGLAWIDGEAAQRFGKGFSELAQEQQRAICDPICFVRKVKPPLLAAAKFFARYRDLTAGGFYSAPQGRQDLGYIGNTPLARFDGPPLAVMNRVGVA